MMETLQILLFGGIRITQPSRPSTQKLSQGVQALFVYLLLQPRVVARELLLDLFWQDASPARARNCLATALWRLRQWLEPTGVPQGTYLITNNTGEVGFNWESNYWLDSRSFEQALQPLLRKPLAALRADEVQQIETSLTLYRGDLLEGMYEDWALRERERFRTLHLNSLARLMEFYISQGNLEQGIVYGQEILRRDPVREEIHRSLMRAYLANGQRSLAIRQYNSCSAILAQELDLPPLEETEALYQQIITTAQPQALPQALPQTLPTPQVQSSTIDHLLHELHLVRQRLDETNHTFERLVTTINQLVAGRNETGNRH
ncbi:MAG: AfsR/SARP family transcriptional regulator [Caldilineaceae bacterium]